MSSLALTAMGMGIAAILLAVPCLASPDASRRLLLAFSRNRPAGWLLAAVSLAWAMWLLWNTPLGRFDGLKPVGLILSPVAYVLIVICMNELLAARALGSFLILLPAPILDVSRWHDSPLRLVVVVLAYVMATAGIALVLSPYLLRRWLNRLCPATGACRRCGAVFAAIGVILVILSITAY